MIVSSFSYSLSYSKKNIFSCGSVILHMSSTPKTMITAATHMHTQSLSFVYLLTYITPSYKDGISTNGGSFRSAVIDIFSIQPETLFIQTSLALAYLSGFPTSKSHKPLCLKFSFMICRIRHSLIHIIFYQRVYQDLDY